MSTPSNRFSFPIWDGTDEFKRLDFNDIHMTIDDLAAIMTVAAGAPTSASLPENTNAFWFDTITEYLWFSDGSTWRQVYGFGDTADIVAVAVGDAADGGTSTLVARADHRHEAPDWGSTPAAVSTAAATGSASTIARGDHVHALGSGSVTTAAIATDAVTAAKINPDVAGTGIGQDADGSLKVNVGSGSLSTLDLYSDTVIVRDASLTQSKVETGHRLVRVGSTAPASTSLSPVSTGDLWIDTSGNAQVRVGSSWVRPVNLPWGIVARTEITTTGTSDVISGASTTPTVVRFGSTDLAVTTTLNSTRLYRIRGFVPALYHTAAGAQSLELSLLGNGNRYERSVVQFSATANAIQSMSVERIVQGLNTGSQTWSIGLMFLSPPQLDNAYAVVNGLLDAAYITIEDVGPA